MNDKTVILILSGIILLLLLFLIYQRVSVYGGLQKKLRELAGKLAGILEQDSEEKVMIFTDQKALMELGAQINLLLSDRQKMKADYRRSELSSRKMLSNISHDMKTPLTVVLGYLEILRLKSPDDENLKKVEAKSRQVLDLITQFFTLAKLEAGDTNMKLCRININELCREAVLGFYDILQQKAFQVDILIPDTELFVFADRDALQRILYNLISNAVRYGSDGCYLGFTLREEVHDVCIDVIDKGKGIDPVFSSNVFERLYTLEDSRSRLVQGNGLGLTIAKSLANQLGGDILLHSEPGVKTVFTLTLRKLS